MQIHVLSLMDPEKLPPYVLLVAPDSLTKTVDYTDRGAAVLWGDGAAAAVLSTRVPGRARCSAARSPRARPPRQGRGAAHGPLPPGRPRGADVRDQEDRAALRAPARGSRARSGRSTSSATRPTCACSSRSASAATSPASATTPTSSGSATRPRPARRRCSRCTGRSGAERRRRGRRRRRRAHLGELSAALRRRRVTYAEFRARRGFEQAELLAFAHGNLVEDAPEGFATRLPLPPMLMVDRVLEITRDGSRGRIVAERDVQPRRLVLPVPLPRRSGAAGLPRRSTPSGSCSASTAAGPAGLGSGRALGWARSSSPARSARTTTWSATRSTCGAMPSFARAADDRDRRRAPARRRRGDLHDQAREDRLVPRHRLPRATRIRAAAAAAGRWSDERAGQACSRPTRCSRAFRSGRRSASSTRSSRSTTSTSWRATACGPRRTSTAATSRQPDHARRAAARGDGAGRPRRARHLSALEGARRPRRPRSS